MRGTPSACPGAARPSRCPNTWPGSGSGPSGGSARTTSTLLILDEIGYLLLDKLQANLLFQVIARRYERGSLILTSNKGFSEWRSICAGDSVIASTMLDCLLHYSHVLNIRGESYRLKEKREAGLFTHALPLEPGGNAPT